MPIDTTELPIGRALKVERTIVGISLTLVAVSVGISIGHLSRIEKGERTASPELIAQIRSVIQAADQAEAPA